MTYVNYLGDEIGLITHDVRKKPKKEQPEEYHMGWRVTGIQPVLLREARDAHRRAAAMAREQGRESKDWNEEHWLMTAKRKPVRAKPYEVRAAAEECKALAEKAGWKSSEPLRPLASSPVRRPVLRLVRPVHLAHRSDRSCVLRSCSVLGFDLRGERMTTQGNAMKAILTLSAAVIVAGCSSDADVASYNLSKAADQFEVQRRVVFYNGITGEYILSVEGLCSLGNSDTNKRVSVTCKTGPSEYKKHFLGLSDNVTFFAEQMVPNKASAYYYRVVFKPQSIVPDIDVRGSTELPGQKR